MIDNAVTDRLAAARESEDEAADKGAADGAQGAASAPAATGDSIPRGNRLVRTGGDRGLSLAEKFAWQLRQLHYGSFLHKLRLRGRFPLKLLAAPQDIWSGDAARGRALLDGRFEYQGVSVSTHSLHFGSIHASPAWKEWLHSFRWLRDLAAVIREGDAPGTAPARASEPQLYAEPTPFSRADLKQAARIVEPLIDQWLKEYSNFDRFTWRPDILGERLMQWMVHAPFLLSSTNDQVYRSAVLNHMARSGRHLAQTAEKTPNGLERVKASVGLAINGLLLPNGETRVEQGEQALARALDNYVLADGCIASRCPEEHLQILQLLLTARSVFAARDIEVPVAIVSAIDRMVPALRGMTMGDGHLTTVHSGGLGNPRAIALAGEVSGVSGGPMRNGVHSGFQRLDGASTVIVLDAGPPPPGRISKSGHAGTLAFEMSDGADRLVVNCGGGRDVAFAPDVAAAICTTAAHSTLVLADKNSTRIREDGGLGQGINEVTALRQEGQEGVMVEAIHDGYVSRYGLEHTRRLYLSADGRDLRGEDQLVPVAGGRLARKASGGLPFAVRFHLGQGVEVTPTGDRQGALLKLPGGGVWTFKCRADSFETEDSFWIDQHGRMRRTRQLVVSGTTGTGEADHTAASGTADGGATVKWTFKRSS